MIVNKMTVDGNAFFLDAEQDVDGAKDQVVKAAQSGAGFVQVLVAGHSRVSVLVSSRIPVTFEEVAADEPAEPVNDDDEFWKWAELAL